MTKNHNLKLFFVLVFLSVGVQALENRKPSSIDLKSSNEIVFYSKKDNPFSDMGKIDEYQGTLVLLNEASAALGSADLYKFPKETAIKMTKSLCRLNADKIFGPEPERSLKMNESMVLFDTAVGKACEYKLTDTYAHAKRPHAYVISGFIHGRLVTLVWALIEAPSNEATAKLRQFWKSLK